MVWPSPVPRHQQRRQATTTLPGPHAWPCSHCRGYGHQSGSEPSSIHQLEHVIHYRAIASRRYSRTGSQNVLPVRSSAPAGVAHRISATSRDDATGAVPPATVPGRSPRGSRASPAGAGVAVSASTFPAPGRCPATGSEPGGGRCPAESGRPRAGSGERRAAAGRSE
jgi:hypothetical protein